MAIMDKDEPFHYTCNTQFDAYESFFDHDWAKKFHEAGSRARLKPVAFELTRSWKGIALAARTPWLMLKSLKSLHDGFVEDDTPFHKRLSRAFVDYVVKDTGLSNMRKRELVAKVDRFTAEAESAVKRLPAAFDPGALWNDYLALPEFSMSLWSLQQMSYGAVYFSYENFVWKCVKSATGGAKTGRFDALRARLASAFTVQLQQECLDEYVDVARLVRNCLVHSGGKASPQLLAKLHRLSVVDGVIQIQVEDVRALFDKLKMRAMRIVEAACGADTLRVK